MKDQISKLVDAASNNDLETLKSLMEKTDATLLKDEGWRIAHATAKTGNLRIVRNIAEKEPTVLEKKNEDGEGVAHIAAKSGHLGVVQYVEEQRPSTFQADAEAVAEVASRNDHFDIVMYLARKHDSVLHHQFRGKNTVIHLAVEKNLTDVETLKFFVEQKGISLSNAKNGNGDTVAHIAARNGNLDLIRYIAEKEPMILKAYNKDFKSVITLSNPVIMKALVEEKYPALKISQTAELLVRVAARNKYWDLIRYMIEKHPVAFQSESFVMCPPACEVTELAIREGLLDITQSIIEKVDAVADHDAYKLEGTMAHVAAGEGQTRILKYLVTKCPKMFISRWPKINGDGNYVMQVVAERNTTSVEDFKYLVEKTIDPAETLTAVNRKGKRVVDIVASKGNLDIIRYIMERDPPVLKDKDTEVIARLALNYYHDNIVWYMVQKRPSILTHVAKDTYHEGYTDLEWNSSIIKLIFRKRLLDAKKLKMLVETSGLKYLVENKECAREIACLAIQRTEKAMVQYVALKHPSVFARVTQHRTIFDSAIKNNVLDAETTKFLIDNKGLPLLQTIDQKKFFVKKAAIKGNIGLLEYLEGRSPGFLLENIKILFQMMPNDIDIVKMVRLIERNDHHRNASSWTSGKFECKVVHMAAYYGRKTFLEQYLNEKKTTDVNMKNLQSETPIFTVVRSKHFDIEIFKFLVEQKNADLEALSPDKSNILFPIAERNDLRLMIYVLDERKAPIDINWQNASGDTLLHTIVRQHKGIEMLKYLVEQKKADVNLRNRAGQTPLHCAASLSTTLISNYLINNGADPKIEDSSDQCFYKKFYRNILQNHTRVRRSVPAHHLMEKAHQTPHELGRVPAGMGIPYPMSVTNGFRPVFLTQQMDFLMIAEYLLGKFIGRQVHPAELISDEENNFQIAVSAAFDHNSYLYKEDMQ